jgi:hypothetical protein
MTTPEQNNADLAPYVFCHNPGTCFPGWLPAAAFELDAQEMAQAEDIGAEDLPVRQRPSAARE